MLDAEDISVKQRTPYFKNRLEATRRSREAVAVDIKKMQEMNQKSC